MPIHRLYSTAALAGLLVLGGCRGRGGHGEELWSDSPPSGRSVLVSAWDTLWSVGGTSADTTLLRPFLLSSSPGRIYVYDGMAKRVTAYGADGSVQWRFGRAGKGPDEFDKVRDMRVSSDGGVDLLDPRNNRITRLRANGTVRDRIPLTQAGYADQMLPIGHDAFVLLTARPDVPFITIDATGAVRDSVSVPWNGFYRLEPLARQGLVAASGERWVFAFSFGDGWFPYRGLQSSGTPGRFVEHTAFPAVQAVPAQGGMAKQLKEYNACSACSVSLSGSTLYVHFGGYSDLAQRVVDLYDVEGGGYRGSWVLPSVARSIEVAGDRVYVLVEDPFPALLALSPRRQAD